jgi:hypothetical protein
LVQTFDKGFTSPWFHPIQNGQLPFLCHDCILVVYVVDCLIFAKESSIIDALLKDLVQSFLLQDESETSIPVDSILYANSFGPARSESWNYWSVIGKLNYLANNTRPDISMAVHQCAHFCSNPKALHELAIKRISRCLLKTQEGITISPTTDLSLNMFVDADFASHWHKEYSEL